MEFRGHCAAWRLRATSTHSYVEARLHATCGERRDPAYPFAFFLAFLMHFFLAFFDFFFLHFFRGCLRSSGGAGCGPGPGGGITAGPWRCRVNEPWSSATTPPTRNR